MKPDYDSRENWREEKSAIDKRFQNLSEVEKFAIGALFGGIVTGVIGFLIVHRGDPSLLNIVEDFYTNFSMELVSIFVTIFIVDTLLKRRGKEEEKKRLIGQMGSYNNAFATEAVRLLISYGWLFDGSLRSLSFRGANLQDVRFRDVNIPNPMDFKGAELQHTIFSYAKMQGAELQRSNLTRACLSYAHMENACLDNVEAIQADFRYSILSKARLPYANFTKAIFESADLRQATLLYANLSEADLTETNLEDAYLFGANLQYANLAVANLQKANLVDANLQQATLSSVDLRGANLTNANLQGAYLFHARLDTLTILPDKSKWSEEIGSEGLQRFTNPEAPNFWKPIWAEQLDGILVTNNTILNKS